MVYNNSQNPSKLIVEGRYVKVEENNLKACGYDVLYWEDDMWKKAHIESLGGNKKGKYRVYLSKSKKGCTFHYLHNFIYAYYMGWDRLLPKGDWCVHHICYNIDNYNDLSNLVYMPISEHCRYHRYERYLLNKNYDSDEKTSIIKLMGSIVDEYIRIKHNDMMSQ